MADLPAHPPLVTHACVLPLYEGADPRETVTYALLADGRAFRFDYYGRKPSFVTLLKRGRASVTRLSTPLDVTQAELHLARHGGVAGILPESESSS